MDESAVWFERLKTTVHEKSHLTEAVCCVQRRYQGSQGNAVLVSSKNSWTDKDLTADWLQQAVGKLNSGPRLRARDSHLRRISTATKVELKRIYNITAAGFT